MTSRSVTVPKGEATVLDQNSHQPAPCRSRQIPPLAPHERDLQEANIYLGSGSRVLHIIASVDPRTGGPAEGILKQNEAGGGGGTREVVSLDDPNAPFLTTLSLSVHALGDSESWLSRMPGFAHYRYSRALIPWLRANASKYDAFIVNGLWNYATWAAARVLPRLNKPYFVFTHGMLDPWFRRKYPIKHILKQAFWMVCEGRLLASADSVWFTTEEEMLVARGQFAGYRYKGEVIGYGTSPPPPPSEVQRGAFFNAAPNVAGRPYLLFLSRIHPKKGCDLLIEAFSRIQHVNPDLQLVIAGPGAGDLVPKLKSLAARRGVADRIHWPGMLQGDAKWGAFHGAEAFILPSHQENFGIVVAEALACGKPVLITNKVNIWREVDNWKAGIVRSDTLDGTIALLDQWISLSAQAKIDMGHSAGRLFRHSFDVRLAVQNMNRRIRAALEDRAA